MSEIVGWIGSVILVLTISKQVHKQWSDGNSEGVSFWLFAGQIVASVALGIHSFLIWSPVFIFTNVLMIIAAILGLIILIYHKKSDQDEEY